MQYISSAVSEGIPRVVAGHNLHSAYLFHTESEFRGFYDYADVVLADGAPVIWDYRFSRGRRSNRRLGSTDWLPQLRQVAGLQRICVVGASPESNTLFLKWLTKLLPDAHVQGIPGDNWNQEKADHAAGLISEFAPQLILIGIGMPRQEIFATRLLQGGCTAVVATIGGAIDQLAGVQRNAPRWTGRVGLEWLFRLATQPKRLWRRYLVEPLKLLWLRTRGT